MTGLRHDAGPAEVVRRTDSLRAWLAEHHEELVAFRRNLHAHPELSRQEYATTDLVAERLELAGLEVRRMSAGTGLIAELAGGDGPTIALRADLDALAMSDEKDVPYASQVPGVAHACGHDVHTSAVLGAALHLAHHRHLVRGRVRFVFQPAEEQVPGGALDVLADGALDDVDAVIALHCEPKLDAGVIAVRNGPITSAADSVEITVLGPGGHTARPELTIDMIAVVARLISELPERVMAAVEHLGETKVVFGAVHAGDAGNVIPTHAVVRASVRTPSLDVWEALPRAVSDAIGAILDPTGATFDIAYIHGVPPVVNDVGVTDLVRAAAERAPTPITVVEAPRSWGGDDFAWLTRAAPGTYVRLGVHDVRWGGARLDLHAGHFDVDERAIGHGVQILVGTVHEFFDRSNPPS